MAPTTGAASTGAPNGIGHDLYAQNLYVRAAAEPFIEWQIVLLFYTAVHLVNHVVYNGGNADDRVMDHRQREFDMANDPRLKTTLAEYRVLLRESVAARYKPFLRPLTRGQVMVAASFVQHLFTVAAVALPDPPGATFPGSAQNLAVP